MIELFFGNELSDDDLRSLEFGPKEIKIGIGSQIDFILVCPENYTIDDLWPIYRNLKERPDRERVYTFRGEKKFIVLVWH